MAEAANDTVAELREESAPESEEQLIDPAAEMVDWDADPDGAFEIETSGLGEKLPLIALGIAAVGWIGFVIWAVVTEPGYAAARPADYAEVIALACIPLALIGIVWLLVQRTSRREAIRFGRTSEAMRDEAKRLDASIASITAQLNEMRGMVSKDTDRLMRLGEEAAGRLGTVGSDLRDAGDVIEERAKLLDSSTKSAREDVEVLLADLPRAERQARSVSAGLREAGVNAHEQAVSLDAQLSALSERGREANELANGAAQKLAANLAQIEGVAEVSARKLDETGEHIKSAVDEALKQADDAVSEARRGVEEIARSLAGAVETSRTAFEDAGAAAGQSLDERIGAVGEALDTMATKLGGVEARVAAVNEDGAAKFMALGESVSGLQREISAIGYNLGSNDEAVETLIARAAEIKATLDLSVASLNEDLPEAISTAEARTSGLHEAVSGVTPEMESLKSMASDAKDYIAVSRESLGEQRDAIDAFVTQVGERIMTMREDIASVETSLAASDEQAKSIANSAAPQLIEALLQVRETADQAAEKARAAFGEVIPQSAAALSEATNEAMNDILGERVESRIAELHGATEQAVAAAQQAAEHLAEKIAEVESASTAIESRLSDARADAESADMDVFARRVTLLIESLNSTAIDVTKILSNDVTDTAWAAYLKGDRGIFARRAVRLLDAGEAREIASQYEMDGEFKGQVNRYVHDFEAMLRRVLSMRGGSPMAVTLLSSDNGKLYVALAQAIERFRD